MGRLEQSGMTMQTPDTADTAPAHSRDSQAIALCRAMAAIHRRGWCDGTGGNFSVVLERSPNLHLLMAPSGVDKGRVRASQLILVNGAGDVISGQGKVSAEMPLHRAIVLVTGAGAVLHTHSQASTLLSRQTLLGTVSTLERTGSLTTAETTDPAIIPEGQAGPAATGLGHLQIEGLEMLKGLDGIHTHQCQIGIPVLANDQDLIRLSHAAAPHLETAPHGILIAGHGLYAWGKDLEQAMRHLEILEFLLEQTWRQRLWEALITPRP